MFVLFKQMSLCCRNIRSMCGGAPTAALLRTPSLHVIMCLIKLVLKLFAKLGAETGFRHKSNLGLNLTVCQAPSHLAMKMGVGSDLGQAPKGFFVNSSGTYSTDQELNGYGYNCSIH